MSNWVIVEKGAYFLKIGLSMGVKFGGAAENNGNNTHLLLTMLVRISQKVGLMRNFYYNMYTRIISTRTQMSISRGG